MSVVRSFFFSKARTPAMVSSCFARPRALKMASAESFLQHLSRDFASSGGPNKSAKPAQFGSRSKLKMTSPPPPAQPPPPAPQHHYPPSPAPQGGGGSSASPLAMIFAGMFGTMMMVLLMQRLMPRKMTVVHKDREGYVVDPMTGRRI